MQDMTLTVAKNPEGVIEGAVNFREFRGKYDDSFIACGLIISRIYALDPFLRKNTHLDSYFCRYFFKLLYHQLQSP